MHLPGLSYLRLDGSVPAAARHGLVSRFNADPSIDLLLLTTSVGGLGLNLTGADTVVFVEHDWNPMKDLQVGERFAFCRLLATAALWVRIQTSLKNTKMGDISKGVANTL